MTLIFGPLSLLEPSLTSLPSSLLLQAVIIPGDRAKEGTLVQAVALPWFEIIRQLQRSPELAHQIHWRKWEEIIAAAYHRAGFEEVILTPRAGDGGRDVVATKNGIGSIRFFDQVKAYKPGHLITAEDVRAMAGVLTGAQNVSKGIISTTSDFAPGIVDDEFLKGFFPYRIELKNRAALIDWLGGLAKEGRAEPLPHSKS